MQRWQRWASLLFALPPLCIAACGALREPSAPPAPLVTVASAPSSALGTQPFKAPPHRDPLVGPHGETASLIGGRVKIVSASGGERIIEPTELHPPSGDPALLAILPTALLFLDDGTLLVGVGDGSVTALDGAGHRRWSLGFRGAIRGLVPVGEGLVFVTTDSGVVALMTGEGRPRWERQITAEPLSPAVIGPGGMILTAGPRGVLGLSPRGELVFSHAVSLNDGCCSRDEAPKLSVDASGLVSVKGVTFRLDGAHPPIPSLEPTFPLTYRKALSGDVVSLLPVGPQALLALVEGRAYRREVVRVEGSRITRIPLPDRLSRVEVLVDGEKLGWTHLWADALVQGPSGAPWLLGRRMDVARADAISAPWLHLGAGQILEQRGGAFRERNDLLEAFVQHPLSSGFEIMAAPDGPAKLLCFGSDTPACAAQDGAGFRLLTPPEAVFSVSQIGDSAWLMTYKGEIFRSDGQGLVAVPAPTSSSASGGVVAGTGERDVWAALRRSYTVFHHDGARWSEVGVPAFLDSGLSVRAPDDVWSKDGRAHWDGQRWSLVHGAPPAVALIARGPNDVWLGGPAGLWHGTAPGLSPVRLPAPAQPDEGALAAPLPLPLGAPEAGYAVDRTRFDVAGGEPLAAGKSIAASQDGLLWVQAWDRLIEVDLAGKATALRRGERLSSGRWFYPEGPGRGVVLQREGRALNLRDAVERIDGPRSIREDVQLDRHDAMAVHGDGRGAIWVVGTFASDSPEATREIREVELSAHALVRAGEGEGFRPVLGLPSASFLDVAATPDGGAWFAGALNAGPMGEGILFRARGRLGSEATSRYRAPATLRAVAAFGPDEAWAVGAAGTVVHVAGGAVTRYALASGAWLWAVAGSGPNDLWIGGEGGTLLHYDGRAFHAVAQPLGERTAITGIAVARGAVWAVGPSGILKITKRP